MDFFRDIHSMSYYVKVVDGVVVQGIVANAEFFNVFVDSSPGTWLETKEDGSLRANFAGVGYIYDSANDVFYPPRRFASWTISAPTWKWTPPVPHPTDDKTYDWDESTLSWVEI